MSNKLDFLHKSHTWDIVDLPPTQSAVGCRWVYKIKTEANGIVEQYKACLVAKGFAQEYSIYYEEKFIPTTCLTSTR